MGKIRGAEKPAVKSRKALFTDNKGITFHQWLHEQIFKNVKIQFVLNPQVHLVSGISNLFTWHEDCYKAEISRCNYVHRGVYVWSCMWSVSCSKPNLYCSLANIIVVFFATQVQTNRDFLYLLLCSRVCCRGLQEPVPAVRGREQKHCQFIKLPENIEGIFQVYSSCIKKIDHFNICTLLWPFGLLQMFAFIFGMLLI